MKLKQISALATKNLISILKNRRLVSHLASQNLSEVQKALQKGVEKDFSQATFDKNEEIVKFGELDKNILARSTLSYTKVPLGIIISGEVIVIEDGKGVKRLSKGDFVGAFETAFFLSKGRDRKIGTWSLVADNKTTIIFFPGNFWQKADSAGLQHYLVDLARTDSVPKPITDLALLDSIANQLTKGLLEDTIIVTHTHLLPTNFALFRHLAHLVGYTNLFILEKPYSTVPATFNQLVQMGAEVIPVVLTEQASYQFALKRSLDVLWNKVLNSPKKDFSKIILLDDGGELILSIPWEKLHGIKIAAVEQTQRGIDQLTRTHLGLPLTINVAESFLKKQVESTFIAKSVTDKIKSLGLLDYQPTIGIIGTGSIGSALNKELAKLNLKIINYDTTHHLEKFADKERVTSIDTILNKSDLIIGCSGNDFLKGVALERVFGKKTLLSASSADIEFFSILNLASFPTKTFEEIVFKPHQKLELRILNAGFPINFDRSFEWEPSEDIQVTRSLLYAATIQAAEGLKKTAQVGILNLKNSWQEKILLDWLALKRERDFSFQLPTTKINI